MTTLFYPLVTFVLVVVVAAFYAATALFLASTGNPQYLYIDTRNLTAENLNGQPCNISVSRLFCLHPGSVNYAALFSIFFRNKKF